MMDNNNICLSRYRYSHENKGVVYLYEDFPRTYLQRIDFNTQNNITINNE